MTNEIPMGSAAQAGVPTSTRGGGGPEDPPTIRLLRGQVVIREDLRASTRHFSRIIVPDVSTRHNPDAVAEARTFHRGTVLAMGAPMLTRKGAEVPHGFAVGDEVVFHWSHHEKSWARPWVDGELAAWVPQWAVDGVVEPDPCETHSWIVINQHHNENRTRTVERCTVCRRGRYGCFAHRLDTDGFSAWGEPGEWSYSERTP